MMFFIPPVCFYGKNFYNYKKTLTQIIFVTTIFYMMKIEFDPNKNRWNIKERNLSFEQAIELDWDTAQIIEDVRNDYPEQRFVATAYLQERLHIICFTPIEGGIRVISFRKANPREVKKYEQATINR
jgi:uncharacterized DUF497 family protein